MNSQKKLTRTQQRDQRRIARYGDPESDLFTRWMAKRDWSLAEVADGLEKLAAALLRRPGHIGLLGGGYAYYPADPTLTRWQATDDSDFQADLLTLALSYAGTPEESPLDGIIFDEPLEEFLITRRVDQAELEAGQMRGDWR